MRSDATDRDLVLRTLGGDSAAFGTLVARYLRPALAVAWEFVPTRDEAEDVVQEAFHRALRKLRGFEADRPFGPWFFTIVRNLGRNSAARRARWKTVSFPEALPAQSDPHRELEAAEIRESVERVLAELSPMQRSCFRLQQVEGFESEEVARMLGIKAATVRTHVHRARSALQERLSGLRDERR